VKNRTERINLENKQRILGLARVYRILVQVSDRRGSRGSGDRINRQETKRLVSSSGKIRPTANVGTEGSSDLMNNGQNRPSTCLTGRSRLQWEMVPRFRSDPSDSEQDTLSLLTLDVVLEVAAMIVRISKRQESDRQGSQQRRNTKGAMQSRRRYLAAGGPSVGTFLSSVAFVIRHSRGHHIFFQLQRRN
jgi:hypothetical protein